MLPVIFLSIQTRIKDCYCCPCLQIKTLMSDFSSIYCWGAAVAEWLSSWLAEQEVWSSIPSLAT